MKVAIKIASYNTEHENWNFCGVPCCHFQTEIFEFHTRKLHALEFWKIDLFALHEWGFFWEKMFILYKE